MILREDELLQDFLGKQLQCDGRPTAVGGVDGNGSVESET
jgi:hypothetical protein